MRYSALTFMLLAGILMASGCTGVKSQGTAGQLPVSEKKMIYRDVMDAWTQEGRIYDGLLTKLISKVTFKSAVFRQAYTEEYARLYKVEGAEYDKLVVRDQKEAAQYHDFVIAAYVPEKKWDDFSKETSMWKIYITRDHLEQIKPLAIHKLNKKDPIIDYFYPYMTAWKSIYHVRFPAFDTKTDSQSTGDPHDALTLVMTSVIGSVEFKWEYNQKQ
jgi:hypothetical protein